MRKDTIRILIVDDRAPARAGLRALLSSMHSLADREPRKGPETGEPSVEVQAPETWASMEIVGEAENGYEAICQMNFFHPDVIIMDARMPVLDGLHATRLIKLSYPKVKVIILTMYATHRAEALAAGADAFLVKGCSPEELLEAITGL